MSMVLLKSGKPYSNIIRRKDNKLFCHTFTAVSPREKWVSFAVSEDDVALLHATLAGAAASVSCLKGKDVSSESFYHRGEAIKILKKRFLASNAKVSDSTIYAVAFLVQIEASDLSSCP